ncbi:hypothetical protein [Buchnera aphidicola]|uniref:Flagellar basal-body rod protein FlgF n=1 Tax=Buchnera aphidicola (Cinara strobi) TaxID=1921549 RepID=A0A3B1E9I2_9GAMM|nr:hypothetical protein [Buchnera aphidicola]VAX76589.1 Flagellar basal-body rod protein FlgF [Buchnera aphidicola (Cinara strobi)]
MGKIINPFMESNNKYLINCQIRNKKKEDQVKNNFEKQFIYKIKIHPEYGKIINKQDVTLDSIHVKKPKIQNPSSIKNDEKETGWFSILDEQGNEAFLREGNIDVNENHEVSINNYVLLNIQDQPIKVPENKKIFVKLGGIVVIKEKHNKQNKKPISLGQLKFISLSNNDIVERYNSKVCDLNDSGFEKYKKNEIELETRFLSNQKIIEKNEKETEKLIKKLNVVRTLESDMKLIPENN